MMKRVEYIPNHYKTTDKYVLKEEYNGFGIYEEVCPTGFRVHQSYLIKNDKWCIVCPSYNNLCIEEIYDAVDSYNDSCGFGLKALKTDYGYVIHPQGQKI